MALLSVRPHIKKVKVFSRNAENRSAFSRKYSQKFNVEIEPVSAVEPVIKGSDVVLCATNTNVALFDGNLLEPGQHITGIIGGNVQLVQGGFLKSARREIDNRTAERANVIVTNLRESVISEKQGDLYEPIESGLVKLKDLIELGAVAAGDALGRNNEEDITYHKNNNGTAASEIAVAMLVYEKAKDAGRGTVIDLIDSNVLQRDFSQ